MKGQVFGDYRIVTELGGGAMGEVYYAEHVRIGRRAAIKVLHEDLSRSPEMVERFFTEARTVNDIRHPNIVEITDCAEANGHHYIVMELLEGETLEERIEREEGLPEALVVTLAAQMASALEAAHAHGIVHRDLKPENIYLTNHPDYPDFLKILDFGIAKLLHASSASRTQAGTVLGTPHYMSPEQCLGELELDHRSDIYAMGCVLHEMLTGAPPFEGDSVGALVLAHVQQEPRPVRELRPEVSERLEGVILKALAKDKDARFQSMREMRDAFLPPKAAAAPAATNEVVGPAPEAASRAAKRAEHAAATKATVQLIKGSQATPTDHFSDRPSEAPRAAEATTTLQDAKPMVRKLARIVMGRINKGKLTLPCMPQAALSCMDMMKRRVEPSYAQLAQAIETDPLLSSQILKVANSPVYSGIRKIRSVEEGVNRIGLRELDILLIQLSVHSLYKSRDRRIRDAFSGIWEHCLVTAFLARELARMLDDGPSPEEAYLAALLHDVGKPVIGALLLETEKQIGKRGWLDHESWLQVVNGCHREVGVALAMAWKLPDGFARIIQKSHILDPTGGASAANIVCFANAMAKLAGIYVGETDEAALEALLANGQSVLGLREGDLEAAHELLGQRQRQPGKRRRDAAVDPPMRTAGVNAA